MHKKIWHIMSGLLLSIALGGVLFAHIAPVHAQVRTHELIRIVNTPDASGVNLRSGPSLNYDIVGKIPEYSSDQDYLCFVYGEIVGNPGTSLWFRVNYNGTIGYYSSFYDTVDPHRQSIQDLLFDYNLFGCGSVLNTTYDRQSAVNWALQNATATSSWPGFTATCTYFVSQALIIGGGFTETDEFNLKDDHGMRAIPGTATATTAPLLIDYLRFNYPGQIEWRFIGVLDDPHLNTVPEAQAGDIIAYDWAYRGDAQGQGFTIDHLSFITSIDDGHPYVSEWGTAKTDDGENSVEYTSRYWTYSENKHMFLDAEPKDDSDQGTHVAAFLLHFKF